MINYQEISHALTSPEVLEARLMSALCARQVRTVVRQETSGLLNVIIVSTGTGSYLPSMHCSCSQDGINASIQAT